MTDFLTSNLDRALAFRIYRVQRLLRLHLAHFLQEHAPDLAPEHYFVLFRLWEQDGVRQQALVDPVLGDRANISRHVAHLERLGFVARRPDPEDGRAQLVHLTRSGQRHFEALRPHVIAMRGELFGDMPVADLEATGRVLDLLESKIS